MNGLSNKVCPSAVSATTNGDGPAAILAYAAPLRAAVEGLANRPVALVLTSKTTQLNQGVPSPEKVTDGSLAAS